MAKVHVMYNSCLVNHVTNPNLNGSKLTAIVLDIADHRIFKPVNIKKDEIKQTVLSETVVCQQRT